jgi:hypothetical protein
MVQSHPMRSHTACGREIGDAESVHGSTAIQQDHVLPVGATNGRYRVNGWFCSYPARSRTRCGQAIGDTGLVRGSATIQPDYVHAVVGQREIQG